MLRNALIISILSLIFVRTGFPAAGLRADFSTREGVSGWRVEGAVRDRRSGAGWEVAGEEEVVFFSPPGIPLAARDRVLTLSLTAGSPRRALVAWQGPDGQWAQLPVPIAMETSPQSVRVDLGASPRWRGAPGRLVLVFEGHPGPLVLHSLEVGPWSLGGYLRHQLRGLARKRALHPGSINSLPSPPLFNRTLAYYLNLAAFWTVLIAAILFFASGGARRRRVAAVAGSCLLVLWLISDLRETWELGRTAGEVYRSFVLPPPEEKTFPGLGDFYRFVDFCREHIPEESVFALLPYPFWPFDVRLKNFLYPAKMIDPSTEKHLSGEYPRYLVVYRRPEYLFDPEAGRIYHRGEDRFVSGPGRFLARYDPQSFIFLEVEP